MKIAIVCDWLTSYAGSERVLEEILNCYPEADIFAVVDFLPENQRFFIKNKPVKTTFIQKLPFAKRYFRAYLPWMPLAIEQLDVTQYDLVISNSHAVAKGVLTDPDQVHISYVCSPMRYAWDLQHQYLQEAGLMTGLKSYFVKRELHKLRIWDQRTANGVDHFIADSQFIARRIWRVYRRDADVIYPPVNTAAFPLVTEKEDYYLTASRLVPYKKIDLVVESFAKMPDKKLVVIGDGPEFKKITAKATPNIEILGYQPTAVLAKHMQRAKAFIFPAKEDFGIIAVEAQACGTPVIAYGKGGALETVRDSTQEKPTGLFFKEQTVEAICQAVNQFEAQPGLFDPQHCKLNAERFSPENFRTSFKKFVAQHLKKSL